MNKQSEYTAQEIRIMSADEIRSLVKSRVLANFCGKEHLDGAPCTECFDNSERICQDKEAIKSALLNFAAIVERCSHLREIILNTKSLGPDGQRVLMGEIIALDYIEKADERK